MRPVLRPGAPLVRRDRDHVQIGTAPGGAFVVRERPGLVDLLRLVDGIRTVAEICDLADASTPEAERDAGGTLDALRAAGVLLDARIWERQPSAALAAEARHLTARGVDPAVIDARLGRRAATTVEISYDEGTQPLAERVHAGLVDCGVPASLAPVDVPGVVVLMSLGPCPRDAIEVLSSSGVPHLPVSCEEDRVRIGPLVRPGLTPCVACDDAQRAGSDPAWPVVLHQLARPLVRRSAAAPHVLGALTTHAAAVAVTAQVLSLCDGRSADAEGNVLTVGPEPEDRSAHRVPYAAGCACQILGPSRAGLADSATMAP